MYTPTLLEASGAKCNDLYDAWQLVGDIHCLSTKVLVVSI